MLRPVREIYIRPRRDLCPQCFPGQWFIRLGRNQRRVVRRALEVPSLIAYPAPAEREAVDGLVTRGLLVPAPGLPGAYRIRDETLAVHLRGAILQHLEDRS